MNAYVDRIINLAKIAYENDDIPVGAIIVRNNEIIGEGFNTRNELKSVIGHAEINAIENACKYIGDWRLDDCVMYVTLEPCMMCLGAIIESRIKKVVYGTKNNSEQMYVCVKNIDLIHANSKECSDILTDFFKNKRKK